MRDFIYHSTTKIVFGKGEEAHAGREVKTFGGTKALLHYGSGSVVRSGLLEKVKKSLEEAGVQYITLGGVTPNPVLSLVRKGIEMCIAEKVDFILCVGGGSVIDSGKAIALGAARPGIDVWDEYFEKKNPLEYALPVGSVLTIAASGSEMSAFDVITNEDGYLKKGINGDCIRPKFAILNPELMATLPRFQAACGVSDIMMHTIERYFSPVSGNDMSDAIAVALLKVVKKHGIDFWKDPSNYDAASEIMWAGSLSHNDITGLGGVKDFAVHQIGLELSGMFNVAHGASLTAVWDSWAKYTYGPNKKRFAKYAVDVWDIPDTGDDEKTALSGISATENFFKSLDMPVSLSQIGLGDITDETIDELAEKCTYFGRRTIGSIMKLGKEDIKAIYKMARAK